MNSNYHFNMASKNVRVLCRAQFDCFQRGSINNNIASRKTEVFLTSSEPG